jgi:valyl-tRNA synthetase
VQDALVRYNRMRGARALWQPGLDHAGIATQYVVERHLLADRKLSRHDLGRDAFVKEIWRWKEEHGHTISGQLRSLGVSTDWSEEYFTLDAPRCANARPPARAALASP